jgi:hypothetical protein
VVVEGVKGGKQAPSRPKITKNSAKKQAVSRFFGLKIAKNAVFRSKVLNKIYFQYVF